MATVHEVAAGIAAEYFNAVEGEGRAFALVTAGPGLTNIVTALALADRLGPGSRVATLNVDSGLKYLTRGL